MSRVDLYDVLAVPSNDIDGLHVIMMALYEKFFEKPDYMGISPGDSEDFRAAYGLCLDILRKHRKYLDDLLTDGADNGKRQN